jgi:hypothetical protein
MSLPAYKGSTLRGSFGHAFKRVTCALTEADCDTCLLRNKCAYSYVFFTPPPPSATRMRKYPHAPHPFILEPPDQAKQIYAPGESLAFGVVLIGKGMEYLPYFVFAFSELGKHGMGKGNKTFTLESVSHVTPAGKRPIFTAQEKLLDESQEPMRLSDLRGPDPALNRVRVNFLTPARVISEGRLSPQVEFSLLVRSLLRRLSTLAYFHCGVELALDYKGIIQRASNVSVETSSLVWYDWERYSSRQDARLKVGGVLGSVTYTGPVQEFIPLLVLGEHLHVGKATSMGLGKYQIARP